MNIMKGTTEITAELSGGGAPQLIFAKQGDAKSRFLRVKFLYGGKAFPLDNVSRTEIRVKKPDGRLTVNDGSAEYGEDGAVSGFVYPLSAQSLTAAGEGAADFILFGKNNEVISTVAARLMISEAPAGDKAVESLSEYAAFEQKMGGYDSSIKSLQSQTNILTRDLTTMNSNYGKWIAGLSDQLASLSFKVVSEEEYSALAKPYENAVYLVTDESVGKFSLYFGSLALKNSAGSLRAAAVSALSQGFSAKVSKPQAAAETEE